MNPTTITLTAPDGWEFRERPADGWPDPWDGGEWMYAVTDNPSIWTHPPSTSFTVILVRKPEPAPAFDGPPRVGDTVRGRYGSEAVVMLPPDRDGYIIVDVHLNGERGWRVWYLNDCTVIARPDHEPVTVPSPEVLAEALWDTGWGMWEVGAARVFDRLREAQG